jgi:tRNA(adenine34) deaminase
MDQFTTETTTAGVVARDLKMMRRCIELSKAAATDGEFPFASMVCRGDVVLAEATNRVARERDITRHAELVAVSLAQKATGKMKLAHCTLYSNVEPCVMCAFPLREARVGRVVFALKSPLMGGFSRWNVLADDTISDALPEAFGQPIEVVAGLLADEAEQVWRAWNPLIWSVIKRRGCFEPGPVERRTVVHKRRLLHEVLSIFHN